MKVVNSKEMFDLEKQAIASGISERKMMKNAAKSIVKHLENSIRLNLINEIAILVGKGNNGTDAIMVGALLSHKYNVKHICRILYYYSNISDSFVSTFSIKIPLFLNHF